MLKPKDISPFRNSLCIALDVDSRERAITLAQELRDVAGAFKLGPRLIHRYGQVLVQELATYAPVFVDCKFFDIPSTMVAAVRATFETGASVCTVHALAGMEALEKLAELEVELNKIRPFRILAVTILTSWSESSMPSVFKPQPILRQVQELARLVKASGLRGLVCSPHEIAQLSPLELFLLTPGIRLPDGDKGDQQRVLGPGEAIVAGSSVLVVGRPIVNAKAPLVAAQQFLRLISE